MSAMGDCIVWTKEDGTVCYVPLDERNGDYQYLVQKYPEILA